MVTLAAGPHGCCRLGRTGRRRAASARSRAFVVLAASLPLLSLTGAAPAREGARRLDLQTSRRHLVDVFTRADTLRVTTWHWPGPEKVHVLGVVRRADDAKRWQAWIRDFRRAEAAPRSGDIPVLQVRLSRGRQELAWGNALPRRQTLALFTAGNRVASVQFASSLHRLLAGYEDQWRREADRIVARERKLHPPPNRHLTSRRPPAATFAQAKARLVHLFRAGNYVNIAPSGGALDTTVAGRAEWQRMTRAIELAPPGPALAGPPHTTLAVMIIREGQAVEPVELGFTGGVLGCRDPYYGGDTFTLRPGRDFAEALASLTARARENSARAEGAFRPQPRSSSPLQKDTNP